LKETGEGGGGMRLRTWRRGLEGVLRLGGGLLGLNYEFGKEVE